MFSNPLYSWIAYVGVGAILLLTIVFIPKRTKVFVGRFLSPNWMSVVHVPIAWIGYFWAYREGHHFLAIMLVSFSGGLDLADGRVGRAYDELVGKPLKDDRFWTQMNHRGTTPLGKVLDPLADKITIAPIFMHVIWTFFAKTEDIRSDGVLWSIYFGAGLIALMLLVDLGGQLIRLDYFKRWRLRKKKADKSATDVGKTKALAQWVWLPLYVVWEQGWLPDATAYLIVLDVLLAGLVCLTVASLLSKMRPLAELYDENFSLE